MVDTLPNLGTRYTTPKLIVRKTLFILEQHRSREYLTKSLDYFRLGDRLLLSLPKKLSFLEESQLLSTKWG